jgi:long-chain acyl-CoA synthetase
MPNGMYGSLSYREVQDERERCPSPLSCARCWACTRPATGWRLQMPNCLAYPVALLGVLKAGCVAVNTNPLYTASEMAHQFKDSGAKAVVIVDMFADKLEAAILPRPHVQHVVVTRVPEFFPPVVGGIVHAVMKYWNRVPRHG